MKSSTVIVLAWMGLLFASYHFRDVLPGVFAFMGLTTVILIYAGMAAQHYNWAGHLRRMRVRRENEQNKRDIEEHRRRLAHRPKSGSNSDPTKRRGPDE